MASKNLGAVIQRAISDGAFRRQLQSDPAAALRGFNLTPNEIAAIRSGDASKLMSLGVDQRVSKAFTVGGGFLGATRSATSDMGTGAASNGIIGDPTGARDALSTGSLSGTRAVNDTAPFEGNVNSVSDPTLGDTRAIHDSGPADLRSAASTGDLSGTRAVQDTPPFEGNVNAVAPTGDPYSGQYIGTSPDFQASVADRMADSAADVTRSVNDVTPFDSGTNTWTGGEPGGAIDAEAQVDVHYVQGNAVEGIGDGGALGNTGGAGNTES